MKRAILTITLSLIGLSATGVVFGQQRQPQTRKHDPNITEAIPIVVSPRGLPTKKFSLPAGSYTFVVLNRTGFQDVKVYLERMPGNRVTDPPTQRLFGDEPDTNRARLLRNAKLTPGTYRLRVANRPSWVCAIQVR